MEEVGAIQMDEMKDGILNRVRDNARAVIEHQSIGNLAKLNVSVKELDELITAVPDNLNFSKDDEHRTVKAAMLIRNAVKENDDE